MRKKAVSVGLKIGIASHGKEVKAKWGLSRGQFHTFFFIFLAFSLVFLKKCCIIISIKNVFEKLIH